MNALDAETAARQAADQALQGSVDAEAAARQQADQALQIQLDPLTAKLAHFSIQEIDGFYSVVLAGANLHIVNGLGATNGDPNDSYAQFFGDVPPVTNGLGNLILGYNESRGPLGLGADVRTGSHNLVVGLGQNYSSCAGLLGGGGNTASGPFAAAIAGLGNNALGRFASVSGGTANTASGLTASATGGSGNTASGPSASVTGGSGNVASGLNATVSGGANRSAVDTNNWVAGGAFQAN
jgi:hypothetical protein